MPEKREVSGAIAEPVPALDAFIFDGKYLFDGRHEVAVTQQNNGAFLVHLDGNQRDRLHVSAALLAAFPGLGCPSVAGLVHSKKILVLDFAYYVLQGNAVRDGYVVVPTNQQPNDVRAKNLAMMPGTDRKAYRSTEIVPRDGLIIDECFRFLPRSVTVIRSPQLGEYQFKVSPKGAGGFVKFGFLQADAARIFRNKVVPLLMSADADFLGNNAVYQDLCGSYFVAFPETTTPELISGGGDNDTGGGGNGTGMVVDAFEAGVDGGGGDIETDVAMTGSDDDVAAIAPEDRRGQIRFDVTPLSDGIRITNGRYAGALLNRAVLVHGRWVVMKCNRWVAVLDHADYNLLKGSVWTMNVQGYVVTNVDGAQLYMHRALLPESSTVDHIDWITTDNRRANMRAASMSEQNHNRVARGDKILAGAALRAIGIDRLPRGMRKDASIGRYTCQDHRACKNAAANGTRRGDDDVAKFKDCLEIYIAALSSDASCAEEAELGAMRYALAEEYNAIVKSAHEFDAAIPDGPYADVDATVDDLTYARQLMAKIVDVRVARGPRTLSSHNVLAPNGLAGAIGRVKGGTLTLYDERFAGMLSGMNWDVDGKAPRVNKIPLAKFVWTQLAGRSVPDGHVIGTISRRAYDVRLENLEPIAGAQSFRVADGDWLMPADVGADALGMRFLPKGVTVNSTKVMISQAGRLTPGMHGADDRGLWSRTFSRDRRNVAALVREAVECLENTHGRYVFGTANAVYQRLLGEYVDAESALFSHGVMHGAN